MAVTVSSTPTADIPTASRDRSTTADRSCTNYDADQGPRARLPRTVRGLTGAFLAGSWSAIPRSRGRSIDQGRLRPGTPRTTWTGGATPAEQHASPAVKTSNPCLPPRDAQGAVGGIRAWGENPGRRASSPVTVLPFTAIAHPDAKSLPRTAQHESAEPTARHRARLPPTVTAPQSPSQSRPEYAQPTVTRASRAVLVHRDRSDKPTDAGPKLSPRTQQSGLRPSARRAASPPPRRSHERQISTFRQACSGTPRSSGHRRTDGWSPAGCGRSPAPVGQRFRGAAGPAGVPMARPPTGGPEIAGVS